jgi:hypothetical protein
LERELDVYLSIILFGLIMRNEPLNCLGIWLNLDQDWEKSPMIKLPSCTMLDKATWKFYVAELGNSPELTPVAHKCLYTNVCF